MEYQFPQGFLWGTATAAHQVEGNNTNSDFWVMEHVPDTVFAEPSGDAIDHYHRYPGRYCLAGRIGVSVATVFQWNGHGWNQKTGRFSTAALDHYRRMCGKLPCARSQASCKRIITSRHRAGLISQGVVGKIWKRRKNSAVMPKK